MIYRFSLRQAAKLGFGRFWTMLYHSLQHNTCEECNWERMMRSQSLQFWKRFFVVCVFFVQFFIKLTATTRQLKIPVVTPHQHSERVEGETDKEAHSITWKKFFFSLGYPQSIFVIKYFIQESLSIWIFPLKLQFIEIWAASICFSVCVCNLNGTILYANGL